MAENNTGSILGLLEGAGEETPRAPVVHSIAGGKREPNPQQRGAINVPLDVAAARVLAGPGSGKTFVMTRRLVHLLRQGIRPSDIVAVTLTKRMATEMWTRLVRLHPGVVHSPLERTVCTIHALCYRIWRDWTGEAFEVPRGYEVDQKLEDLALAHGFNGERGMKATPDVLQAWVNSSKGAGYTTQEAQAFYDSRIPNPWVASALGAVRRGFDEWLAAEGKITFADMLLNVEVILRRDEVAKALGGRYVIMDEGQDATNQAMRILTRLAQGAQFFSVGDQDQLLFRFAGATPEQNLGSGWEALYPGGLTHKLEVNYRSTGKIITAANRLIAANYTEKTAHLMKDLRPRDGAGDGRDLEFHSLPKSTAEGEYVAERIIGMRDAREQEWGSFFVGGRTRASLAGTERALTVNQVPYVNLAGRSFWDVKHVKILWSYVALALDSTDKKAFKAVYNVASRFMQQPFDLKRDGKILKHRGDYSSHRWLGRAFLREYRDLEALEGEAPADVNFRFREGAQDLLWTVRGIRDALANAVNWTEVMGYIIEEVLEPWYRDSHNLEEGQGSGFREDVDVVVEIAQEYPDPAEFIAFANKMLEATHKEDAADEVVILGTIHALKGRERPVVFWVGAAEGICPTPFALGQVVQRENELPPPGGPSLMEDERCCAYVVVTRAQQHVIITAPEVYRQKVVPVSRFVHELLGDVIAGEVTHTQGLSPQEAQEC